MARPQHHHLPVQAVFEGQVRRTPDAMAVVGERQVLTYQQLNRRANRLAHHLRTLGVGPETQVAVCLDRSPELLAAMLAVLKAGGAFVALDPAHPPRRVRSLLADCRAPLLVTQARYGRRLAGAWRQVLVDDDAERITRAGDHDPKVAVDPRTLAYVVYTSGSTGAPKGVAVEHHNLASYVRDVSPRLDARPGLRYGHVSSISADLGYTALFVATCTGGCLHLLSVEHSYDPARFAAYPHRIDVLKCTPSHLRALLTAADPAAVLPAEHLVLGGEAVSRPLIETVWRLRPDLRITNHYGPTETTIGVATCTLRPDTELGESPPIGWPIAGARAYVLDEQLRLVPDGTPGELYVAGAGVARGYLHRPDLTAERFLPDPFSPTPGGRMYRTGDRCRRRPDGALEFLGRSDRQVKVRGFRVELGEVEAALRAHPDVTDAAVVAYACQADTTSLTGYVTVAPQRAPTANGLPKYELPNRLAVVHNAKHETDYLYEEIFERHAYLRHGVAVPDHGTILDVGANIGLFSLFVHGHRPSARLVAFEPNPSLVRLLRTNVELYAVNATVLAFGLAADTKQARLTAYRGYSLLSGVYADPETEFAVVRRFLRNTYGASLDPVALGELERTVSERLQPESVDVQLRRLSDVLRELRIDHVGLLKINVEKSELDVLQGIDSSDWPRIDQVVLEVDVKPQLSQVLQVLEGAGFRTVVEQDERLRGTDLTYVYATRPVLRPAPKPRTSPPRRTFPGLLTDHELRRFASSRLPAHMVPTRIVPLESFPRTNSGKVDLRRLPAVPERRPSSATTIDAATVDSAADPTIDTVARVWAELLNLESPPGPHDGFVQLGGYSLLAAQVVARLRQVFGVELPMYVLLEDKTTHEIAAEIDRLRHARTAPLAVERARDRHHAPLSCSQERVWFLRELDPTDVSYTFQALLDLRGPLRVASLRQCLQAMVDRHEILRTAFHRSADGAPYQRVQAAWQVDLPVVDPAGHDEAERERAAGADIAAQVRRPYDVSCLPLVRWTLYRLSPERHLLLHAEHHLIHDGWSFRLFLSELAELYRAGPAATSPALAEPPMQFVDFAATQRWWLTTDAAQQQIRFWRQKLRQGEIPLELPFDRPRQPAQRHHGVVLRRHLPAELCERVAEFSARHGVTPFMTLLAAFFALLRRSTGQDVLTVGSGVANRHWPQADTVMGMVVNNVVLRLQAGDDPSFAELLSRVRTTVLEAHAHQELPFEKVVEAVKPTRSLSHNPLFQVSFSFHDSPLRRLELPGLDVRVTEGLSNGTAKFDLNVVVIANPPPQASTGHGGRSPSRLEVFWEYDADLFDPATSQSLLNVFVGLLTAALRSPQQRIPQLAVDGPSPSPSPTPPAAQTPPTAPALATPVQAVFEGQVRRTPDAMAVVGERQVLTYQQLNRRANRLAHHLRTLGVGPETQVAVCLDRSPELLAAMLAVLKAGGAFVALDPAHPPRRVRSLLADCRAPLLVTQARYGRRLAGAWRQVLVDDDAERITRAGDHDPKVAVDPRTLAYVVYTSGSTGAPKGVAVEHHNLANLVAWHCAHYGVTDQDRTAQTASVAFDAFLWETWPYLTSGGTIYLPPEDVRTDPQALLQWLERQRISICFLATPLAEALTDQLNENEGHLPALRALLTGGDRLHAPQNRTLPFEFHNNYGPTETTVVATSCRVEPTGDGRLPPIGWPIAGARAYVLDEQLRLVPDGTPGELYVAGAGVARGYLHRPDLTAERFLPDPFSPTPGGRMYRTGDRCRRRPDGALEFLGRSDRQVKVRGFRVELGEVEAALRAHPDVTDAAVVARRNDADIVELVGCYVGRPSGGATSNQLRDYLAVRLPTYMVPHRLAALERLPLTSNGKVDRERLLTLPLWDPHGPVRCAPASETERVLVRLWEELLHRPVADVDSNFFDLGGHSLLIAKLAARIRAELHVDVPLRAIYEDPTIRTLAQRVQAVLKSRAQPGAHQSS